MRTRFNVMLYYIAFIVFLAGSYTLRLTEMQNLPINTASHCYIRFSMPGIVYPDKASFLHLGPVIYQASPLQ